MGNFGTPLHARTCEMPYMQHCDYGAAIALRYFAIMGNQSPVDQEEVSPGLS
jgi:hypothetical protein